MCIHNLFDGWYIIASISTNTHVDSNIRMTLNYSQHNVRDKNTKMQSDFKRY